MLGVFLGVSFSSRQGGRWVGDTVAQGSVILVSLGPLFQEQTAWHPPMG